MLQLKDDLSRSLVALDQDRTLIAVVELSLATWLVGGVVPGIQREPLKKLPPDPEGLLKVLHRWREEAAKAGHKVARIVVAFEAVVMVSGWHVGCRPEGSRPTSYIQRVWRSPVSSDEQRPIDWILPCLSVPSSVGYGARRNTAPWSRSPLSTKRMQNVRPVSVSSWSASAPESSTE